ncbi:MAG: hypothetical protein ACRDTS_25070 [Mycobacterium sp.]
MSFSRKVLLALTGVAALAMPLAVAGSASASTTASGCTVTPLKPVYDHTNSSGQKVINYETKVYCDAGRSIQIQDERLDQDWTSADDNYGTTIYNIRFDNAATVYKSILKVLPDADGWLDNNEEMYHSVGFQVTPDNGYVAPWTNWEDSAIVTFHL